jgi:hypothetical protein
MNVKERHVFKLYKEYLASDSMFEILISMRKKSFDNKIKKQRKLIRK